MDLMASFEFVEHVAANNANAAFRNRICFTLFFSARSAGTVRSNVRHQHGCKAHPKE